MNIAIFLLTYLLTSLWLQLSLLISSLEKKRIYGFEENKKISDLVFEKTGLRLKKVGLIYSEKYFAMMTAFPFRPVLLFSSCLRKDFSEKELEYVVLHEVGHYLLGHQVKEILIDVALLAIGLLAIFLGNFSSLLSFFLAIIFGVFAIQLFRGFEYEADKFVLEAGVSPAAMIAATKKFAKGNQKEIIHRGWGRVFNLLFVRSVPYWERVKIAEEFVVKR